MSGVIWQRLVYGKPVGPDGQVLDEREHDVVLMSAGIPRRLRELLYPAQLNLQCDYWSDFPLIERGALAIRQFPVEGTSWSVVARCSARTEKKGRLYTHCSVLCAPTPSPADLARAAMEVNLAPVLADQGPAEPLKIDAGPVPLPERWRKRVESMVWSIESRGSYEDAIGRDSDEAEFISLAMAVMALARPKDRARLSIGHGVPPDEHPRATITTDGASHITFQQIPADGLHTLNELIEAIESNERRGRQPDSARRTQARPEHSAATHPHSPRETQASPAAGSPPRAPAPDGANAIESRDNAVQANSHLRRSGPPRSPAMGCAVAIALFIGFLGGLLAEARWHPVPRLKALFAEKTAAQGAQGRMP